MVLVRRSGRRARIRVRLRRRAFTRRAESFAVSPAPVRHSARRARQRFRAHRRLISVGGATAAATAGRAVSPHRARAGRLRVVKRLRRAKLPTATPAVVTPGKNGVLGRVHKAVARMRRAMQARLRWKPRPEETISDLGVPTQANPRGRITGAGLLWGKVTDG